jgi:hypothetical protein
VHFLDAWSRLAPLDFIRLLVPFVALALAIVLPGRRVAALAALGVAIAMPLAFEMAELPLRLGWMLLWLAIAARVGSGDPDPAPDPTARPGGIESGAVGLMLGLALFVLLAAAIARQDLSPDQSRAVSYAVAILTLGLLHLMLNRHLLRAMVAFAALGLGLQLLEQAARRVSLPGETSASSGILLGTALAVALTARLATARAQAGGGVWVSQAHDLHD